MKVSWQANQSTQSFTASSVRNRASQASELILTREIGLSSFRLMELAIMLYWVQVLLDWVKMEEIGIGFHPGFALKTAQTLAEGDIGRNFGLTTCPFPFKSSFYLGFKLRDWIHH
ncbi:hypothetical protein VNO80_25242 [Phaseolus coccineus]|uniref:Uncharacterized protein n=1 Tax=Phaseolus coccineus TaxID=3886 RepID=A0AAN9LTX2_PHACN